MPPVILYKAEDAETIKEETLKKLDKEDLVLACLAFGARHIKVVGFDRQIAFFFLEEEVKPIIENMLSGKEMMVDFHKVLRSHEIWRNAIVSNKSERRY